jgi:hypothetical protein
MGREGRDVGLGADQPVADAAGLRGSQTTKPAPEMPARRHIAIGVAAAAVVAAGIVSPAAQARGGPRGEVAAGEILISGRAQWCLTAANLTRTGTVAVARCIGRDRQLWLLSRYGPFLIIAPKDRPDLCLGVSRRGWNTALEDCATENAQGALLRLSQVGEQNMWRIYLLNDRALSATAKLNISRIYPASWQVPARSGPLLQFWSLPKWRPAP